MASKTIPFTAEPFLGDEPCVMKVAKVTYGVSSGNPDVVASCTSDAVGLDTLFDIPANMIIHDIGWQVTESFTNGATLTLGPASDPDGFATAAHLGGSDAADAEIVWMKSLGLAALMGATFPTSDTAFPALAGGFTTSGTDAIGMTSAAVTLAAGAVDVYVVYSMAAAI